MPLSRKKSCVRCRQSKLKCNQATPRCSRCSERGTKCVYDWKVGHASPYARTSTFGTASQELEPLALPSTVSSEEVDSRLLQLEDPDDFSAMSTSSMFMELEQQSGIIGMDHWSSINAIDDPSLNNMLKTGHSLDVSSTPATFPAWTEAEGTSGKTLDVETIALTGPSPGITSSWFLGGAVATSSSISHNNKCSASSVFIEPRPPRRTFQRRHILRHCALSSVVVGQLTNFPKMLIQGHHLPPFITPPCHVHEELAFDCAKSGRHRCLIKELAICAGLVEMFFSRTAQNADFVWKMIYAERDRLRREHESYDVHHQLAALQAVTIYILLQARDSEDGNGNETDLLLKTVLEIAMSASERNKLDTETLHKTPSREQWIHEESGRRTIMVLLIINLMLDCLLESERNTYETSCRSSFETMLLPATRDLWEAPTNFIWRTEYERCMSRRKSKRPLRLGDLLQMNESRNFNDMSGSSGQQQLDIVPDVLAWCEGLDSLGSLIWMVLPFQQWRMSAGMNEVW